MLQLAGLTLLELDRGEQINLHPFSFQNAHQDQSELLQHVLEHQRTLNRQRLHLCDASAGLNEQAVAKRHLGFQQATEAVFLGQDLATLHQSPQLP